MSPRCFLTTAIRAQPCKYRTADPAWLAPSLTILRQLLEEILNISESFVEGEGQRARALYKLSKIHTERGMLAEGKACKEESLKLRAKLKPELKNAPFEEAEFSKLCLWMLW